MKLFYMGFKIGRKEVFETILGVSKSVPKLL